MGTPAVAEVWSDLCRIGTSRYFRAGDYLLRRDDTSTGLVAVEQGLCKVIDVDVDGHEVIVAIRGPGDVFGETSALTERARTASVVAVQPVKAAMVSRREFDAYLDGSARAGRLVATMLAERVIETNRPAMAAHRQVHERLADRIHLLAERFGEHTAYGVELNVPLTHDDFSSWIGATRAVTTRAMGTLRDRELIDFGRGWLRVLDLEGLRKLGVDGGDL